MSDTAGKRRYRERVKQGLVVPKRAPCKYGHTLGRDVHGNCIECVRVSNNKYHEKNRESCRESERRWARANRDWKLEYYGKWHRTSKYGLKEGDFERMLIDQAGLCAICEKQLTGSLEPMIDHDHVHGHVRALLCSKCNLGLHYIEDKSFMKLALRYLEDHSFEW
jgi:hypothetical protein